MFYTREKVDKLMREASELMAEVYSKSGGWMWSDMDRSGESPSAQHMHLCNLTHDLEQVIDELRSVRAIQDRLRDKAKHPVT